MDERLTLEDIAKTVGVTSRTLRNQWKNDGNLMEIFKGNSFRDGKRIFYRADTIEKVQAYYTTNRKDILPINKNITTKKVVTSSPSKSNKENKKLKKQLQELQKANEMLNFQISTNYETINELRKDKEQLYKTISSQDKTINQLAETVKGSLMNTHTAQELNYLDKKKDK